MKKKIFIYLTRDEPGFQVAMALAEDGTGLTSHISSSIHWARRDMGIEAPQDAEHKHKLYREHYPSGYELVDLLAASEDELRSNAAFMQALDLHSQGLADGSPEQ